MRGRESDLGRVAVALDTADWERYVEWCGFFGPRVGVLKVGLEAYVRWGPRAVEVASGHGAEIFLDLKLHDIPNTMRGAVRAVRKLGARYLTVHASGGPAALSAAVDAAAEEVDLLAVTLLTHLDAGDLAALDLAGTGAQRARRLATMARDTGCRGAVCSPLELATLRPELGSPFLLVTPGIRWVAGGTADDQRRTATPRTASQMGADLLVIGRPLTAATDPEAALDRLAVELQVGVEPVATQGAPADETITGER